MNLLFVVVHQAPFEVEESGWGEFETQITIFFADPNEKPVNFSSIEITKFRMDLF